MIDRSRPFTLTSTRIGRTDLGPGTAMLDDDAILLVLRSAADGRSVRVPLSAIDGIAVDNGALTLSLRDGGYLSLVTDTPSELRDALGTHCRAIPELTRALRALGSRRGLRSGRPAAADEQRQFFAPLLNARREALASTATLAMSAFDPEPLERAIWCALQSFAAVRYGDNVSARRALEAELIDLAEPLRDVFEDLRASAAQVRIAPDDLRLWRIWRARVRATFETADRVWMSLDAALDATRWDS